MAVLDAVTNRMMAAAVRHVRPVVKPPPGPVADVYRQMAGEAGLLPPFLCLASQPSVLAALWSAGRESWLAGPVGRLEREVVAAGVSRANECPFCVEAHSMTQRVAPRDSAADPALVALSRWAEASQGGGGDRPFPDADAPWLIGTAVFFHTVNRYVNVLLAESGVPRPMRRLGRLAERVGDVMVGKPMLDLNPSPGLSLDLLPPADGAGGFEFAESAPVVHQAFTRADASLDLAAASSMSASVQALVSEQVAGWTGEDPGLDRSWVDAAAAEVDDADRPAAVLGLLTALASYRVDDSVVADFRRTRPSDADLVVGVVWPAWQAAKRVGSRLAG